MMMERELYLVSVSLCVRVSIVMGVDVDVSVYCC